MKSHEILDFYAENSEFVARCTASSLDFAWIDVGNEGMIQNYQSSQQPPATHPPMGLLSFWYGTL